MRPNVEKNFYVVEQMDERIKVYHHLYSIDFSEQLKMDNNKLSKTFG